MFTDNANLFFKSKTVKTFFLKANLELEKNFKMLSSKQTFFKLDKTRFTLFHKVQDRDNLSLQLPVLNINNYKIKKPSSIKFLGVMVD